MTLTGTALDFAYDKRPILQGAAFDPLQPGELTALIGPNASGKSTLFRVIAGLLTPSAGMVTLGDTDLATLPDLSGGQAQMVAVAQALIRQADVYLFDEPTSALDLHHQLDVLSRFRATIANRNAIGIVALHDLNLAARFADHLILLRQGTVLAQGAPAQVLQQPEIGATYGVDIHITTGPKEDLVVHAYAP